MKHHGDHGQKQQDKLNARGDFMKKIILCILMMCCFSTISYATDVSNKTWCLYVNNEKVDDNAIVEEEGRWVSFRMMFEALGAAVVWKDETETIEIMYNSKKFVCEMKATNSSFPEKKYLYITDTTSGKMLLLTSMSYGGIYRNINDHIYISPYSIKYLLQDLYGRMEEDIDNCEIRIFDTMY